MKEKKEDFELPRAHKIITVYYYYYHFIKDLFTNPLSLSSSKQSDNILYKSTQQLLLERTFSRLYQLLEKKLKKYTHNI